MSLTFDLNRAEKALSSPSIWAGFVANAIATQVIKPTLRIHVAIPYTENQVPIGVGLIVTPTQPCGPTNRRHRRVAEMIKCPIKSGFARYTDCP